MPTTIKYKGSIIASLGAGEIGAVSCADKEMEGDIMVIAPESEESAVPTEVSTEAEMTALLESGEVGGVYKYTGETGTYENGAMYVLEEIPISDILVGTWTLSAGYSTADTWTLEGDISGKTHNGSTIAQCSYDLVALSGTFKLLDTATGNNLALLGNGKGINGLYGGQRFSESNASMWAVLSQFTINSVSTTDITTLEAALAWLQTYATKQ